MSCRVAKLAKIAVYEGRKPIILFNNTGGGLATLQTYLQEKNHYIYTDEGIIKLPKVKVRALNSHTKKDPVWNTIAEKGRLDHDTDVWIFTSVLEMGNSLLDELDYEFILSGHFHSSSIEQVSNRPRRARSICMKIVRSHNRELSDWGFKPAKYGEALRKDAQHFCDEHNEGRDKISEWAAIREMRLKEAMQKRPIQVDETGKASVSNERLSNFVYLRQAMRENRNDELMSDNLKKYGVAVKEQAWIEDEANKRDKDRAKERRAASKAIELRQYQDAIMELENAPNPGYLIDRMLNAHSENLSKGEKKAFQWSRILEDHELTPIEAMTALKSFEAKKASISLFVKRLNLYRLEIDDHYMQQNRLAAIIIRAFRDKFQEGDILDFEEIRKGVKECLSLDPSIELELYDDSIKNGKVKRNYAALKLLRIFFEVERKVVKIDDVTVSKLIIGCLEIRDLFNTNRIFRQPQNNQGSDNQPIIKFNAKNGIIFADSEESEEDFWVTQGNHGGKGGKK